MKFIFLILLIGVSLNSFGQNSPIQDIWTLQDLIINGESHLPPSNNEISNIYLVFSLDNQFSSNVCETLGGTVVIDDVNHNFFYNEIGQTLGGGCSQRANSNYESIYFNFYYKNLRYNPFDYSIIINGNDTKTLTITSLNGDQAIYSSNVLSNKKYLQSNLSLFYNKINSSVDITSTDLSGKFSVKLFDFQGKLILELDESIRDQKSINIQHLNNGLYFVILQTENGEILNKKIIKY